MDELDQILNFVNTEVVNTSEETLVQRYSRMENKSYAQLLQVQELLDQAIAGADFQMIKSCVGSVKDLTTTYNELCRLRRIADVEEGNVLPMEVLERYKTYFYPKLQEGIENMRISIENLLPTDLVPEFKRAWNMSYYRYTDAAKEAENGLIEYKQIAQMEALSNVSARENNKHKAANATRKKLEKKKKEKE
jgi:hypothetical protein